jgi:hypothetical protein
MAPENVTTPVPQPEPVWIAVGIVSVLCLLATNGSAEPAAEPLEPASVDSESPATDDDLSNTTVDRGPLAETADLSPRRIFSYLDLDTPLECGALADPRVLKRRTDAWREATHLLDKAAPDKLLGWLIGRRRPPRVARRAARTQLNCLFDGMFADAARAENSFHVDVYSDDDESLATGSPGWVRRYNRRPQWRSRIRARLLRSHIRRAPAQARIWIQKFGFHTDAFGVISDQAGELCPIEAGRGWHPGWPEHRHCWLQTLEPRQREREILQTSSAPGISRHHWGSEFDIFTLRPASWEKDALFHEEYRWLEDHALEYGFFQPYHGASPERPHTYIEERWHWSYYPVATALTDYLRNHRDKVEAALIEQWASFASRYRDDKPTSPTGSDEHQGPSVKPYFQYIREHWFSYATDIVEPTIDG